MRRSIAPAIAFLSLSACLALASQAPNVTLRVDLRAETATVTNNGGGSLNLNGWTLVSVTGDQRYAFSDMTLAGGASVIITSGSDARHDPPRYIRWTRRNVWNNDGDPGRLYDASGNLVAQTR